MSGLERIRALAVERGLKSEFEISAEQVRERIESMPQQSAAIRRQYKWLLATIAERRQRTAPHGSPEDS